MSEKVEHVREAIRTGQAGNHHCHWNGCKARVAPAAWGCRKHWYMLPKGIRARIWAAYRPGQEETKTPSRMYVEVAKEARDWIAVNHPEQESML